LINFSSWFLCNRNVASCYFFFRRNLIWPNLLWIELFWRNGFYILKSLSWKERFSKVIFSMTLLWIITNWLLMLLPILILDLLIAYLKVKNIWWITFMLTVFLIKAFSCLRDSWCFICRRNISKVIKRNWRKLFILILRIYCCFFVLFSFLSFLIVHFLLFFKLSLYFEAVLR